MLGLTDALQTELQDTQRKLNLANLEVIPKDELRNSNLTSDLVNPRPKWNLSSPGNLLRTRSSQSLDAAQYAHFPDLEILF